MNKVCSVGVEAPARQGARSAHTGRMQATSNEARRDASAATLYTLFIDRPLPAQCRPALQNHSIVGQATSTKLDLRRDQIAPKAVYGVRTGERDGRCLVRP